jgi:hypothetical protein
MYEVVEIDQDSFLRRFLFSRNVIRTERDESDWIWGQASGRPRSLLERRSACCWSRRCWNVDRCRTRHTTLFPYEGATFRCNLYVILTYSMEQSPSWEANQWTLQLVKNFPEFMEPESPSPYPQVPATYVIHTVRFLIIDILSNQQTS